VRREHLEHALLRDRVGLLAQDLARRLEALLEEVHLLVVRRRGGDLREQVLELEEIEHVVVVQIELLVGERQLGGVLRQPRVRRLLPRVHDGGHEVVEVERGVDLLLLLALGLRLALLARRVLVAVHRHLDGGGGHC